MVGGVNILTVIAVIADFTGIVSFILTIALLIKSEAMRKEIEGQRSDYIKEQKMIRNYLVELRKNVIEDGILNQKVVSDIRTQLFTYQQKFEKLLNRNDQKHLKSTLKILGSSADKIDQQSLCIELDYFVARFERKERNR